MSDNAVSSRSRGAGAARLWRGWVVALLAVLLAAGGHQAAHSLIHGVAEAIPWELLGFSTALTAPVAVVLAGKRISIWSTGLTTLFGQLIFHTLYSLPSSGNAIQHSGHGHHQVALLSGPHTEHVSHVAHTTAAADTAMLLAHVLAAALTTVVIVRGERSLVTIVGWLMLVPVKLVLATLPISTAGPKPALPRGNSWIPHPMNVSQKRWTRGPPVLA